MVTDSNTLGKMTPPELFSVISTELSDFSDDSALEAMLLLSHCFGIKPEQALINNVPVGTDGEKCEALIEALQKRKSGYPLQYILGKWEFFGLDFFVGEGVLIPRADTEAVIEAVLKYASEKAAKGAKSLKILDLCSGSGCIAAALKSRLFDSEVFAVEKSETAFSYLQKNILHNSLQVKAILGDALYPELLFDTEMKFDIIVSNPPYISAADMSTLQAEVRYEPEMSLFGGNDGLDFYRSLTALWKPYLNTEGLLCYEIGLGQEEQVMKIFQNNCFKTPCIYRDMCGIIRAVSGINS